MQALFALCVIVTAVNIIWGYDPCRNGQYRVVAKNGTVISCRHCPECMDGYGSNIPCDTLIDQNAHIDCVLCNLGETFSDKYSMDQCQPCKSTTCHNNEVVVGECTRWSDTTRCNGTCVSGYHWSIKNNTGTCLPIHTTTTNQMSSEGQSSDERLEVKDILWIVIGVCFFMIIVVLIVELTCYCKKHQGWLLVKRSLKYRPYRRNCQQSEDVESAGHCRHVRDASSVQVSDDKMEELIPLQNRIQNNNCRQASEPPTSSDRMTKKPSQLNVAVYAEVCSKLNQLMKDKDYKEMAGRMGYTHEQVNNFTRENDPAAALLSSWETKTGHNVKKLIEYLRAMERSDIIELLENQDPCYP